VSWTAVKPPGGAKGAVTTIAEGRLGGMPGVPPASDAGRLVAGAVATMSPCRYSPQPVRTRRKVSAAAPRTSRKVDIVVPPHIDAGDL
jgi:hypothetical protein